MNQQEFADESSRVKRYKDLAEQIDHLTKMLNRIDAVAVENRNRKDQFCCASISVGDGSIFAGESNRLSFCSVETDALLRQILFENRCKLVSQQKSI